MNANRLQHLTSRHFTYGNASFISFVVSPTLPWHRMQEEGHTYDVGLRQAVLLDALRDNAVERHRGDDAGVVRV